MHGGNIGYSIRPKYRNMGYGKKLLELALNECKKIGIMKVLLTCDKENIASSKVILYNGGVLENEVQNVLDDKRITQRYWIIIK